VSVLVVTIAALLPVIQEMMLIVQLVAATRFVKLARPAVIALVIVVAELVSYAVLALA